MRKVVRENVLDRFNHYVHFYLIREKTNRFLPHKLEWGSCGGGKIRGILTLNNKIIQELSKPNLPSNSEVNNHCYVISVVMMLFLMPTMVMVFMLIFWVMKAFVFVTNETKIGVTSDL